MKLQNKLFLSIGLLLLCIFVPTYLTAVFLLKRDIVDTAKNAKTVLEEGEETNLTKIWEWFKESAVEKEKGQKSALTFFKDSLLTPLDLASALIGVDPEISLIQIHDTKKQEFLTIKPEKATLYPIKKIAKQNDLSFISIPKDSKERLFLAMPLKSNVKELFLLFDPSYLKGNSDSLKEEYLSPSFQSDEDWVKKREMLEILLKVLQREPFVEGVAFFPPQGEAVALLTKDVLGAKPLFNDVRFYEEHLPSKEGFQIAGSEVLIKDGTTLMVGNTILKGDTYITAAFPINDLISKLASLTNKVVIVKGDGETILSFSPFGEKMDLSSTRHIKDVEVKSFEWPSLKLKFTFLISQSQGKSLYNAFERLNAHLVKRLSLYMVGVILIFLGTAFLVLWFLTKKITKPLTSLTEETNKVIEGKYDEIVFPKVEGKEDEIAKLSKAFQGMVLGLEEREKIRGVLNKVVSKEIAEEILKTNLQLGGEEREVTILFCDIRRFTELTQDVPPKKVISLLNIFMTKMSRIIEGEGGIIDKYVGDEIMALYGVPIPNKEHVIQALSSANLMMETLKRWNQERKELGLPLLEAGIGIHTGNVVVGNMGSEDRLNYTVIGANVNLASRLCKIADPMQIIVSETTLKMAGVEDFFEVKELPPVTVKGIDHPVNVYQVTGFKWNKS